MAKVIVLVVLGVLVAGAVFILNAAYAQEPAAAPPPPRRGLTV